MKTFPFILSMWLLFPFCIPVSATITVHGTPPADVNPYTLEREYSRMWFIIAPHQPIEKKPLHIFFYAENQPPLAAQWLPEWGGGGAVGPDTIVVPIGKNPFYAKNFQQICLHEMAHSIVHRGYPDVRPPRWFHEGVAMTLAGEVSFEEMMLLSQGFLFNRLIPLQAIDTVNAMGESRAQLAYAQSHAVVLFLIEKYGMDALAAILIKAQRYKNFWRGLHNELGLDQDEFSNLALSHIRNRYGLMFIFGDNWFWWAAIAVLFLGVYIITRIRNQKKRREMEEAEALEEQQTETASIADGAVIKVTSANTSSVQSADHLDMTQTETGNIDAFNERQWEEDGEDWEDDYDIEEDEEDNDPKLRS